MILSLVEFVDGSSNAIGIPIYWRTGKQKRVSSSTAGTELIAAKTTLAALKYANGFRIELGILPAEAKLLIFSDNQDIIHLCRNWKRPAETNLVGDYHALRSEIAAEKLVIKHINGETNVADALTKIGDRVKTSIKNTRTIERRRLASCCCPFYNCPSCRGRDKYRINVNRQMLELTFVH